MSQILSPQDEELVYKYRYPHPAVTTDCCIFAYHNGELSVLLIRRGIDPYKGHWALPGGFMRIDETAEQCALRELREETAYVADSVRQFHTYSNPGRDPRERVVSIAFYALVKMGAVFGGDDADEARWFPVLELPELAFDHSEIVHDALMAMRRDVYFEPIGFELLPPTFSMAELQKVIETITGDTYDRRNFYNKMRHMKFVEEADFNNPMDSEAQNENSFTERTLRRFQDSFSENDQMTIDLCSDSLGQASKCCPSEIDCAVNVDMMASRKFSLMNAAPSAMKQEPERKRRSGVRYFFNAAAFKRRKDKKGSGPITY